MSIKDSQLTVLSAEALGRCIHRLSENDKLSIVVEEGSTCSRVLCMEDSVLELRHVSETLTGLLLQLNAASMKKVL